MIQLLPATLVDSRVTEDLTTLIAADGMMGGTGNVFEKSLSEVSSKMDSMRFLGYPFFLI